MVAGEEVGRIFSENGMQFSVQSQKKNLGFFYFTMQRVHRKQSSSRIPWGHDIHHQQQGVPVHLAGDRFNDARKITLT